MGIITVALIPYKGINEQTVEEISKIKNEEGGSFRAFYDALLESDFKAKEWQPTYWYDELNSEKAKEQNPSIKDLAEPFRYGLVHGSNIYCMFGKNTIEVGSWIKMISFIQIERIQKAMLRVFYDIAKRFNALEGYLDGDHHNLYFEYQESKGKFRKVARLAKQLNAEQQDKIADMYIDLGYSDDIVVGGAPVAMYDIKGFYKLNFLDESILNK